MQVVGILGVFIGIAVMIYLVCIRSWNVFLATLVASAVIALMNGLNIWTALTDYYLYGAADWVQSMLILFSLGALFGRVLQKTGSAQAVGQWLARKLRIRNTGLVIFLLGFLFTMGGISSIVGCLTLCPIAIEMARQSNMPRRYVFASFLGGGVSFAIMCPGSPEVVNLMPTWFLGTSTTAAPLLGFCIVAATVICEYLYLHHQKKKYQKKGMGFDLTREKAAEMYGTVDDSTLPCAASGLVPLCIVIVGSILFGGILAFDSTLVVCASLTIGIIVNLIWTWKNLDVPVAKVLEEGAADGIIGCLLCAAVLGWVEVVKATDAFMIYANWTNGMGTSLGYVGIFLSIQLMAIVTGNSPGTLNVFLTNFAQNYISLGMVPEVVHRLSTASCIGFDVMPHNPGTITYLRAFKFSYLEAYLDVFVCCAICPAIGAFAGTLLAGLGIC